MHQKSSPSRYMPSFASLRADALVFYAAGKVQSFLPYVSLLKLAGTDVVAHTLTIGTWHLLQNPLILEKLQAELRDAGLNKRSMNMSWSFLERLPYLVRKCEPNLPAEVFLTIAKRAVIKESLRLSHGLPGKLPRVVPHPGVWLCGQRIPPGVSQFLSSCNISNVHADNCFLVTLRLSHVGTVFRKPFPIQARAMAGPGQICSTRKPFAKFLRRESGMPWNQFGVC